MNDRRSWHPLASLGLFLAVVLVGSGLLLSNILAIRQSAQDIIAREDLANSVRHTVKEALAAALLQKGGDNMAGLLPGESQSIAAAALQDTVTGIARTHGAQILSTAPSTASETDEGQNPLRPVKLDLTLEARMPAIQALLFHLEAGKPSIVIDRLQLTPLQEASGRSQEDPPLRAVMTLTAYWRAK